MNFTPPAAGSTRATVLLVLLGLLVAIPAAAATRIDLDRDWRFRVDPERSGEASGWSSAMPATTEAVTIPHTWNIGTWHDYRGVAWYFRRFEAPPKAAGSHVELHFDGTFYKSRVWLNGVAIGEHEGGFTAYTLDVTRHLSRSNLLVVELDNRPGIATIPGFGARGKADAWYDWWAYGGIVRDVWLSTTGPIWIRRQHIRTSGAADDTVVREHVFIENALKVTAALRLKATAVGPDGRVAATLDQRITLAPGAGDIALSMPLPAAQLWSIDHPNVYRMDVELTDQAGESLDRSSDTFGVRTMEIRDRHLLINGERVRLTGLARHEDSPWEGLAETAGTMRRDYDDMKALQTTLTRPVHYPQNSFILDYADRHGIVLIPEIPVWQFSEAQLADPRVLALAKRQMQEMIEQAGNHPSIFGWSTMNESAAGTPGGIAYFRAMRDFIHQLDPGRYVSFADDNLAKLGRAEESAAKDADFLMMNQYYGSWHGPASAFIPALDTVDRLFPDKMVIISEMGYAGIFAKDAVEADAARIATMKTQMPELARRDWIAGAILWCYQDYKSPRNLWPGQVEGYVEHGVVDEYRQRKPSYAVWQELSAPARIKASWSQQPGGPPTGFTLTVTPNGPTELPSYPLHDYHLRWTVADEKGKAVAGGFRDLPTLSDALTVTGELPADAGVHPLRLSVSLLRPMGVPAAERGLDWTPASPKTP